MSIRSCCPPDPSHSIEKVGTPGTMYICPMHPHIRRNGPGACPVCGMSLVPELTADDHSATHELSDLTMADVGLAMGTGTDVAIESAGITLLKGDLTGIVKARRLSHATMNNIRQNLFFAFIYNMACIPIAAGILYPISGVLLSPVLAAAVMSLSSLSVIANALRLRFVRI